MELSYGFPSNDNAIVLSQEESNHLINVKRFKTGDVVNVTDGKGNLYTAELIGYDKKLCTLRINKSEVAAQKKFHLHIAVAPTKNIDRIEWFLEKAVETGIQKITFLNCRHSERKVVNEERLLRVAVAAMKQSKKTFLPEIFGMIDFEKFICKELTDEKLIFTMSAGANENLKKNYQPGKNMTAIIGPEGDFQNDELELAKKCGYVPTSLGPERLRTETAALAVCTLFNFINSQ